MTDNTDNQLDIENDEIMAEIAFEKRMRLEMDAHDIAAEQAGDSALTNYMGH